MEALAARCGPRAFASQAAFTASFAARNHKELHEWRERWATPERAAERRRRVWEELRRYDLLGTTDQFYESVLVVARALNWSVRDVAAPEYAACLHHHCLILHLPPSAASSSSSSSATTTTSPPTPPPPLLQHHHLPPPGSCSRRRRPPPTAAKWAPWCAQSDLGGDRRRGGAGTHSGTIARRSGGCTRTSAPT